MPPEDARGAIPSASVGAGLHAGPVEKLLLWLVLAGLAALAVLALAGVFLFTLGFDESWILRGIQGILQPAPSGFAIPPVGTSGGIYAFAQIAITALVGPALWPQRLFVLACLAASAIFLHRWVRASAGEGPAALLAVAAFCSTPGILVLGSTAYAAVPAFMVALITAAVFWNTRESRWRWAMVGVLGGVAAATRFNSGVILPALVAASLLSESGSRRRDLTHAIAASLFGFAVFLATAKAFTSLGSQPIEVESVARASGVSVLRLINYPKHLNQFLNAQRLMPLPLIGICLVAGAWAAQRMPTIAMRQTLFSLGAFGVLAWFAWLFFAPIPHLRYALPALAAFHVVGGVALAHLHAWGREREQPFARIAALAISVALIATSGGTTLRHLVHGDANAISWEWAGEARISSFSRFRALGYQKQAARYLREARKPDEATLALGGNMSLAYLSERPVLIGNHLRERGEWNAETLPRHFMLGPVVGKYLFPTERTRRWILENAELEAQIGPYSFYRVTGAYPSDPDELSFVTKDYEGHPLAASYP